MTSWCFASNAVQVSMARPAGCRLTFGCKATAARPLIGTRSRTGWAFSLRLLPRDEPLWQEGTFGCGQRPRYGGGFDETQRSETRFAGSSQAEEQENAVTSTDQPERGGNRLWIGVPPRGCPRRS